MIKIIFSDFDNTLMDYYSSYNYFDEYRINVLRELKKKGIKFCITTGRCISFFSRFSEILEIADYIIGSNGACIYDIKSKKIVYQKPIDNVDFNNIVDWSLGNNYSFLLNCRGRRFFYGDWEHISNCEPFIIDNDYMCDQIVLSFNKEGMPYVFEYLDNIDGISVNNISFWDTRCSVDINQISVSKGETINWLCDNLNIDINDTMAFGDGKNDKSMFDSVGTSVAMGNAVEELKVVANDVALDCSDNGFYKYIEDKILK